MLERLVINMLKHDYFFEDELVKDYFEYNARLQRYEQIHPLPARYERILRRRGIPRRL